MTAFGVDRSGAGGGTGNPPSAADVSFLQSGSGLSTTTVQAQLQKSEFFDTIAALKLYSAPTVEVTAFVRGYYSAGDGGGGLFRWDSASTATDNGGTIIQATGITTGRWERYNESQISFRVFGCKLDDTTDDATAAQAALDHVGDTSVSQRSGVKLILDGPMLIGSTLTARRRSIVLEARGWGRREDTDNPNRPYIRWDGSAGSPMLKVQDMTGFRIKGWRFIGKSTAKPSAALNFNETNDGIGITANTFEDIYIGGGLDTADDAEQFTAGVLIDGTFNGSNSEHIGKNLRLYKCQYGIYVGRTQNVNIRVDGYYPAGCSSAAVYNAGQVQIQNFSSSSCAVDFYSPATDDGSSSVFSRTVVIGYLSETAGRMAEIVGSGYLSLPAGGTFSLSSSTNSDGKVIKAEGNTAVTIDIPELWWLQASSPPTAPFLSLSPSGTGYRHITLLKQHGWTRLTGGTRYGMTLTSAGVTDRIYLDFSEDPQTTGFFPINRAVNYHQGLSSRIWDPKRQDAWNETGNKLFDDFNGPSLDTSKWGSQVGTDPQVVAPAINVQQAGAVRLVTGDDAAGTMAANGVQIQSALNWDASAGSLVFECRIKLSAITNVAVFLGFTDQTAALEMPIESAASADTITTNATDAVGVMFDTSMSTDNWWLVGVDNNSDATSQNTAVAPVAATYETWRIEIAGNVATFWRNSVQVGTAMTNDIRTVDVTPVVAALSRAAASRNIDIDYIYVQSNRV